MENLKSENENSNELSVTLDETKLDNQLNQASKPNFFGETNNMNDKTAEFSDNNTKTSNEKYKSKIETPLFLFMSVFGIVFMALILVFQIILTPIKVVGSSMQPTINTSIVSETDEDHNDVVYYKKQKSYDNYDIVIIENKDNKYVEEEEYYDDEGQLQVTEISYLIKRIIATENQTIVFSLTDTSIESIYSKCYYTIAVFDANGENINFDDSFILEDMYFTQNYYNSQSLKYPTYSEIFGGMLSSNDGTYSYTIPENSYFVMGDNRNVSEDSRYFGCVDSEDICGAVKIIVPYGKQIWQAIILNKKFYVA